MGLTFRQLAKSGPPHHFLAGPAMRPSVDGPRGRLKKVPVRRLASIYSRPSEPHGTLASRWHRRDALAVLNFFPVLSSTRILLQFLTQATRAARISIAEFSCMDAASLQRPRAVLVCARLAVHGMQRRRLRCDRLRLDDRRRGHPSRLGCLRDGQQRAKCKVQSGGGSWDEVEAPASLHQLSPPTHGSSSGSRVAAGPRLL